ncbi:MAG: gamma-glutamylcyclotransferase [bacterium]|nr:gamma-glutamylcyclotransferase [bacterium]
MNMNRKHNHRNAGLYSDETIEVRYPADYIERHFHCDVIETIHAREVSEYLRWANRLTAQHVTHLGSEVNCLVAQCVNNSIANGDSLSDINRSLAAGFNNALFKYNLIPYFAYGSNMDINQMEHRCPNAHFLGEATLENHDFALDYAGVATVVPAEGKSTTGILWFISREDERKLDSYEGVSIHCYRKERMQIKFDGKEVSSLVYVSERDPYDGTLYRDDYLDNIIDNAMRYEFDPEYVARLKEWQES